MATVTGLTAERMLEIEAASVVDGDVVGNDLILARQDGSIINAGNVRGIPGPTGPMGSSLAVVTAQQLFDIGQAGQIRAGRQLTPSDFTNMGLSAPLGLWNLSNANDSSGNARHLTIKGGVPFGTGINGLASTAAVFSGSVAQALYIADGGSNDPFRIKMGSWGCWFRTAKRGALQMLLMKDSQVATSRGYGIYIHTANNIQIIVSDSVGTTAASPQTISDVCDDHWHQIIVTYDGSRIRGYVDGAMETNYTYAGGVLFPAPMALVIGARAGDATATVALDSPMFGRVDEAFVTSDILSDDQIRNLYCASIPHSLGSIPSIVNLSVRRKRRGAALATTDFPAQPVRLHNFTAGVLTDQGSGNVPLAPVGGGTIADVAGADGTPNGAKSFSGAHTGLGATDAGLPAALASRSYGGWFKTGSTATAVLLEWGTANTADAKLAIQSPGTILAQSAADSITGPFVADGLWHFAVCVEDNTSSDGVKRKFYVDGKMVGGSTVMNAVTLLGANKFRVGADVGGTNVFIGQIDAPFVYAGALTNDQVRKLYDLGSQALAPSPKAAADHIEAIETARLLAVFDSIESTDSIDLAVMA